MVSEAGPLFSDWLVRKQADKQVHQKAGTTLVRTRFISRLRTLAKLGQVMFEQLFTHLVGGCQIRQRDVGFLAEGR